MADRLLTAAKKLQDHIGYHPLELWIDLARKLESASCAHLWLILSSLCQASPWCLQACNVLACTCVVLRQDPGAESNLDSPNLWAVQEDAGIHVGPVCVVGRQQASDYGRPDKVILIGDPSSFWNLPR